MASSSNSVRHNSPEWFIQGLKRLCTLKQKSWRDLQQASGMTNEFLAQYIRGESEWSDDMLKAMASFLGYTDFNELPNYNEGIYDMFRDAQALAGKLPRARPGKSGRDDPSHER